MYLDRPNPKAFIEYPNTMDSVYKNVNDYNPKGKQKIIMVVDDMIVDTSTKKKVQALIKDLFF